MMKLLIAMVLVASAASAASQPQPQPQPDEASTRKAINLQVADLWEKEDFKRLDELSNEYRMTKARTPSGVWKLSAYYEYLKQQVTANIRDPEWWQFMQQRAAKWTARYPNSPSAHLQYAQALLQQGWYARGPGFSSTVSSQGREVFQSKIAEARQYLEKHKQILSQDPRWYELMINIATWQGWEEPETRSLIETAVTQEPEFWQIYFAATEYYSPYWRGDAEKIESFASWAANRFEAPEGDAAYARIYWWAADRYFKSQFFDSKVDCGRMMRGIDRILQIYPDPWNLNHFAKFAVSCGDKKRAKLLFERIGGNPDLDAWKGSTLTFTRFRAWAME